MALTVDHYEEFRAAAGQAGMTGIRGVASWTTTDKTGNLPVRLKHVTAATLTWLDAPASDEILYVASTGLIANGIIALADGCLLPVGRTAASATSGLKFSFVIYGY